MDIIKAAIKLLEATDKKLNYPIEAYLIEDELQEYLKELINNNNYKDEKELVLDLLNNSEPSPYVELVKNEITKQ